MKSAFALVLLVACGSVAQAAAPAAPVAPFRAVYNVLHNDKLLGRATLELSQRGDGSWEFRSETQGTRGLARALGVNVVETSQFRWRNGLPEGLNYDYRQDGAFKQHQRHIDFDWSVGQARVVEGTDVIRYPIVPGVMDRHCVILALAADLTRGAHAFDYRITVKDRVLPQHYAALARERVTVPAGRFDTVPLERSAPGGKGREAESWFAPSAGWLPVQIEQTGKKGDTVTMRLVSFKRD